MLFWCFSVGLQKYKPLLSPRNLNAYRVSISADVGASVFLFTPSLIYRNLAGHRRSISKEIREAVCPLARTNTPPISPLSCHASLCKPACCSCGLRSYTMKRLDDNSDLLKILRCAFETYNTLKSGYLESVYEAALEYELLQAGFSVRRQVRIPVFYKGVELRKDFYADMIVNDCILLELKAVSSLNAAHERQIVSYMKSTGIREGMLLNFGNVRRLEWRAVQ